MVKKKKKREISKGKKLKISKPLIYEGRKKEKKTNRCMAFLNLCIFSTSVAVAERSMLSLYTHC